MGMKDYAAVTFHEDFKIMQLTDVHLVRTAMGGPEEKTLQLISKLVEEEKPDFIAITGDLAYTDTTNNCYATFTRFMDRLGVPWGYAMGNHDDNDGPGYEVLEPILYNTEFCLYRHGLAEVSGYGNYVIGLIDSERKPLWLLYFLDTHDGRKDPLRLYPDQIDWYRNRRDRFAEETGRDSVPAMFFFHVPLREYLGMYESGQAEGVMLETVAAQDINTGFFDAIKEKGDGKAVFVGHDHVNDWAGYKDGVLLAYGRACCYDEERIGGIPRSGYLKPGFLPGCRMISLRSDGSFRTWVRLSDGSVLYNDK